MPVTMFCFFIGSLAAVGVPPTNGFTSKWIIYQALMAEGEPLLALISLIGSVITLAYLARFMHARMYPMAVLLLRYRYSSSMAATVFPAQSSSLFI